MRTGPIRLTLPATPSGRELFLRDDDRMVSRSDAEGRITYCNRLFVEFSGYSQEELIGAPHSLLRHPDMPHGLFKYLWMCLQRGEVASLHMLNLARSGAHCWFHAEISPIYDERGSLVGYNALRSRPDSIALPIVRSIYAEARKLETGLSDESDYQFSATWIESRLKQEGVNRGDVIVPA